MGGARAWISLPAASGRKAYSINITAIRMALNMVITLSAADEAAVSLTVASSEWASRC